MTRPARTLRRRAVLRLYLWGLANGPNYPGALYSYPAPTIRERVALVAQALAMALAPNP